MTYVVEAKVGTPAPDTQTVMPYIADLLEQSAVVLGPVLWEKLDTALQGRVH